MGYLAALGVWVLGFWLIRRDTARRGDISAALWIPTLWAFILLSRPLSFWLGTGGGGDSLEGSPMDRLFYFVMIALALIVLARRNLNWSAVISENWPIFLLYGFFLVSVLWADSPYSSFKRWFKDLGNVFVALVILTERKPIDAFRAVFVRCAYILIPLSVVFVRFFPGLGRYYSRSGGLEVTGVTTQKNSLGVLVAVTGLVLLWDWYEDSRGKGDGRNFLERSLPVAMLAMGAYLLYQCNSQTSILCLVLGSAIITTLKIPALRRRVGALGAYSLVAVVVYMGMDWMFGLSEMVLGWMGRDMTFTGRTDVWREIMALKTDPIIGTGFLSFWSDQSYQTQLPNWIAFSAHNGYLETYIDGGYLGLAFLAVLVGAVAMRVNRRLGGAGNYPVVQFAVLVMILVGSFSESHFARMSPLWFLFLLSALEWPRRVVSTPAEVTEDVPSLASNPPRQLAGAGSWLPSR